MNSYLFAKYKQKYFQQDDEFLVNRIETEKINVVKSITYKAGRCLSPEFIS